MKLLIEVGAYDGTDSLKFHQNGYTVYTFEPEKKLYNNLVDKTKNLKNYHVIPKAVCLTNGKMKFNVCKSGGASSLLKFKANEELAKYWTKGRTDIQYSGNSYEVDTIRLDTFIEENNLIDTTIDYIHIDAQGLDLDCLCSLGKYINNVKEGVLETVKDKNKSIYIGQDNNTLENITKFLTDNNFKITNIKSNDGTGCEYNVFFSRC